MFKVSKNKQTINQVELYRIIKSSDYDSLYRIEHVLQTIPQLWLLYGQQHMNNIDFIPVTQQGVDPACGTFAVAFAFSVSFGIAPESQNFDVSQIRKHLQLCINHREICPFPVVQSYASHEKTDNGLFQKLISDSSRSISSNGISSIGSNVTNEKNAKSSVRKFRDRERERCDRSDSDFRNEEKARKRLNKTSRKQSKVHKRKIREISEEREDGNKRKRQSLWNRSNSKHHMQKAREESEEREAANETRKQKPRSRSKAKLHMQKVRENSVERKAANERRKQNPRSRSKAKLHMQKVRENSEERKAANERRKQNPRSRSKSKLRMQKVIEDSEEWKAANERRKQNPRSRHKAKLHMQKVREDSEEREAANERRKQKSKE